jgi:hypothetical protein
MNQRAEQDDTQLQCAKRLIFQRLFDRRPHFAAHDDLPGNF